jgi:signal transduction histidine kinase
MKAKSRPALPAARPALLAGTVLVVGLGIATSRLAAAEPDAALGGGALWEGLLQLSAAATAATAGLGMILNHRMPGCGAFLALTGPAILLSQLPAQDSGSAFVFTAALVGGQLAPWLAGSAALACPIVPVRRLDRAVIALSLAVAGLVRGFLPAAVFDPRAAGCFSCPVNLAEVRSDPALYTALGRWGLVLAIVAGIGVAVRAGWRLVTAPRILRLVDAPIVAGGVAAALLAAVAAAHTLQLPAPEPDPALRALWLTTCCCVMLMAAQVPAGRLRARWLTGKVSRAIVAALPDPESLRAAMAASIGDPDLALVFLREDGSGIDAAGLPAGAAAHLSAVMRLSRGESAVAEIRYLADLADASHQLVAATRAGRLAIEHVAAGARLRAELCDLDSSRRRIVEAGDAERLRLERNLHDGAQQRLIALQVLLELAALTAQPSVRASFTAAQREVGAALEQLRHLAHGIYPAALADGGLKLGLRMLAETSPVPLVVEARDLRRMHGAVEAAAYRIVADTVHAAGRHNSRSEVTVTLSDSGKVLRARLLAKGLDEATGKLILAGARDRISAADGTVTLTTSGGQLTIEAVIPCAS